MFRHVPSQALGSYAPGHSCQLLCWKLHNFFFSSATGLISIKLINKKMFLGVEDKIFFKWKVTLFSMGIEMIKIYLALMCWNFSFSFVLLGTSIEVGGNLSDVVHVCLV